MGRLRTWFVMMRFKWVFFLGMVSFLIGCRVETPTAVSTVPPILPTTAVTANPLPTPTLEAIVQPTRQASVASLPEETNELVQPTTPPTAQWEVAISPAVPRNLAASVRQVITNDDRFAETAWEVGKSVHLLVAPNGTVPLAEWVYVVVGSFDTVGDAVSLPQVQGYPVLWADAATTAVWQGSFPTLRSSANPTADLWAETDALGLVPFDELTPNLKAFILDGLNPLEKNLPATYPLRRSFGLLGDTSATAAFLGTWSQAGLPTTNRDEQKITRVAVTGVTALVRATAAQMETNGVLWPGEEVAPVLQTADVAHISHEVSFASDCPFPNAYSSSLTFCSADKYLELLTHLGTDAVELTGNHVNDYGAANLARSIDMYEAAGMQVFGGGRDLAQANQPALFEHNGNKIAFLGCNPAGPPGAWATDSTAGSTPCGDYGFIKQQIADLRAQGYVVIVTLQYPEHYAYAPMAQQIVDFEALAEAGATAVSGSQGHHAGGFGFHNGAFIHYGLGNLFFDQMDMLGTRQAFVDNYILYDGRLIGVSLWTGLIESYARPRLMTAEERSTFLQTVFAASDW